LFSTKSKYANVSELLNEDNNSTLEDSVLDDQLWLLLCERIHAPSDLQGLPIEVTHYYASRLVQWEVGNGGFPQAVDNGLQVWFSSAAIAYDIFGKPDFANLIRQANAIISKCGDDMDSACEQCEVLDEQLSEIDWEIDELRIAYVRDHSEAFRSI
jgi:hypothetical protein